MSDRNMAKCLTNSDEHLISGCSLQKSTAFQDGTLSQEQEEKLLIADNVQTSVTGTGGPRYIPPNMRNRSARKIDGSTLLGSCDVRYGIEITNLSETTTEADLKKLVTPFGPLKKRYLVKDKVTKQCKGYAYAYYTFHKDAENAIATLNGYAYKGLILHVDWSKPLPESDCDGLMSGIKFVLPNMTRSTARGEGITLSSPNDRHGIEITNLSQKTTRADLKKLAKPFGPLKGRYLVRNRFTGKCKGVAHVYYKFHNDAANAITALNGYVHDGLTLKVDWSNPPFTKGPSETSESKSKSIPPSKTNGEEKTVYSDDDGSALRITNPIEGENNLEELVKPFGPLRKGQCWAKDEVTGQWIEKRIKEKKTRKESINNDAYAIRVTNLSEATTEADLEDLVKPFGVVRKQYLAKHKHTGQCKGFAYVHYKFHNEAANAITALNGYVHDGLTLKVDWSNTPFTKGPSGTSESKSKSIPPSKTNCEEKTVYSDDDGSPLLRITNPTEGENNLEELVKPFGPLRKGQCWAKDEVTGQWIEKRIKEKKTRKESINNDAYAIRVTNLSEATTEADLEDLVKPFGVVRKRYLAKNKHTGQCKGFAYVHYKFHNEAANAITALNGYVHDGFTLKVDWSNTPFTKGPSGTSESKSKSIPPSKTNGEEKTVYSDDDGSALRITNPIEGENNLEELVKPFGPLRKGQCWAKDEVTGQWIEKRIKEKKTRNDVYAIKITNLSEATTEVDLEDLVKPFGLVKKRYLAKNKHTGQCEGFAYVNYKFRKDAENAIAILNGHVYDNLSLNVDWSEQSTNLNQ